MFWTHGPGKLFFTWRNLPVRGSSEGAWNVSIVQRKKAPCGWRRQSRDGGTSLGWGTLFPGSGVMGWMREEMRGMDLREGSPTMGRWDSATDNRSVLWVAWLHEVRCRCWSLEWTGRKTGGGRLRAVSGKLQVELSIHRVILLMSSDAYLFILIKKITIPLILLVHVLFL